MRELKFRTWNEEEIIILENSGLQYFDFEGSYSLGFTVNGYDEFWAHEQYDTATKEANKYPIMQFTGLKDKNDIDIYEGDIITFTRNIGNWQIGTSRPFVSIHLVVWEQEISAFVLNDNSGYIKFRRLNGKYIYEIIGNIYENTELLIKN